MIFEFAIIFLVKFSLNSRVFYRKIDVIFKILIEFLLKMLFHVNLTFFICSFVFANAAFLTRFFGLSFFAAFFVRFLIFTYACVYIF